MKLSEYVKKRDFKKTPEPGKKIKKSSSKNLMFVVQEHHASHLHYDFRLELDGVLKSWAVPKGPSPDPQQKRLAVEVEDHPYDYRNFQGEIPEDEYGGGEVLIWDTGTWKSENDPHEGLRKGKLDFTLSGKRMKGKWSLIRTHGRGSKPQWLLFKRTDQYSKEFSASSLLESTDRTYRAMKSFGSKKERKTSSPRPVKTKSKKQEKKPSSDEDRLVPPQLCKLVEHPPEGEGWIHELKFDGYRIQAHLDAGNARLFTRSNLDWSHQYGGVKAELEKLKLKSAIFDGEIVALDEHGKSSFQLLQTAMQEDQETELVYYVFDLLEWNGKNLRDRPLIERKEILRKVMNSSRSSLLRFSDHIEGAGETFLRASCNQDLEGIISKRADSPYLSGRSDAWVKAKCHKRQEFVIGGYTEPEGQRDYFGALLLGIYEGDQLRYVGRCGTGYTRKDLKNLFGKLQKLKQPKSAFEMNSPRGKSLHWIKPKLVAEVSFANWTNDRLLRVPVFQGLRQDKPAEEIIMEKSTPIQKSRKSNGTHPATVTHPEKIIFPADRITKQQIADYYASPLVAKRMLPLIDDRPLALQRCPEGTKKPCFFQKHRPGSEGNITAHSPADLLNLVQMGAFEIHAWGSHEADIEHPDQIVMDFDPAPDVPFSEVKKAVLELKKTLDRLKLKSFLKTTGGKGLHVHIPIAPIYTWDQIKEFTKVLAEEMAERFPDRFVSTMSKRERKGKIFVDYLRNGRGATAVVPYSLRTKEKSSVAMPLSWTELARLKDPAIFTLPKALAYLKKRKVDPWKGISSLKQKISILGK